MSAIGQRLIALGGDPDFGNAECGACDPGFVHSGGTVITSNTNVGIMGVAR